MQIGGVIGAQHRVATFTLRKEHKLASVELCAITAFGVGKGVRLEKVEKK